VSFYYNLTTPIGLAWDSIRAHKLRSFLTLLGIIIGVASVVLVGAAIDGLGVYAEGITAKAFGTDSFLVAQVASVGRLNRRELVEKQRRNKPFVPKRSSISGPSPGMSMSTAPISSASTM
jgi:putative ABC transport system permease protein